MSPYALLAALPADTPAVRALPLLLENLARATGAPRVQLWQAHEGGFSPYLSWPAESPGPGEGALGPQPPDLSALESLTGVLAAGPVRDDAVLHGALTLHSPDPEQPQPDPDTRSRLRDTANCVLRVWRLAEVRAALAAQDEYTERLAGELAASRQRLAGVRDLERRRVAAEIITMSTDRLGRLHRRVDELAADPSPGPGSAARLEDLLDELIEDFRVMVRGIYPIVLKTRGPRAALAEVAAGLPRPVLIDGGVPARVDAELGAALYHLVAAALQTLARTEDGDDGAGTEPLTVRLSHGEGRLAAVVSGRSPVSASALRAALSVDADRLSALSGSIETSTDGAVVTLRAALPDRLEPAARPDPGRPENLHARVRAIVVRLAARAEPGPQAQAAGHLLERLDGPVRVGLHDLPRPSAELDELARRLPELSLLSGSAPDEVDVVLRPAGESSADEQALVVELAGAGTLVRAAGWRELPGLLRTEVVARADLLRARSGLAEMVRLLHELPRTGPDAVRLDYELELLRAGAHELAELEAIALLRTGGLGLTRVQVRTAERLLGDQGPAPHERLGLPATSSAAVLRRAASEQLGPWRRLAANAAGRQQRAACDTVVRACESLLTRTTTPTTATG